MGTEEAASAIKVDNTCWIFISDSHEVRHTYDVIHAAWVLRARGVNSTAIKFFTDDPQAAMYTSAFGCPDPLPIASLNAEFQNLDGFTNLFVVVTGHGNVDGIGCQTVKIAPDHLVSAVRTAPGLKLVVIVLTQCFAGVFNFIDARKKPPIVMLGATNLSISLSTQITLNNPVIGIGGALLSGWVANSFMFYLFRWIAAPRDIDGDGRISLLDAYKYAGAAAVSEIANIKPYIFMHAQKLTTEYKQLESDIADGRKPDNPFNQLELKTKISSLHNSVSSLHAGQESWLLHADLARRTDIF
ncbi:hypothetical protein [Pseudomonas sp. PIC25]|uniref:hypothetical protein n=1 Tax=Pseudomonas sp. PIC25 TaxID=1958773 RepID=UPI00117A1BE4|nr:hypothetical protein [Pseudomonas sp. PIC25]